MHSVDQEDSEVISLLIRLFRHETVSMNIRLWNGKTLFLGQTSFSNTESPIRQVLANESHAKQTQLALTRHHLYQELLPVHQRF